MTFEDDKRYFINIYVQNVDTILTDINMNNDDKINNLSKLNRNLKKNLKDVIIEHKKRKEQQCIQN